MIYLPLPAEVTPVATVLAAREMTLATDDGLNDGTIMTTWRSATKQINKLLASGAPPAFKKTCHWSQGSQANSSLSAMARETATPLAPP